MSSNFRCFFQRYTLQLLQLVCLILTLRLSHLLKVVFFKTSPHPKSYEDILVPVNLQDLGACGDSSSDTTCSCQTDETHSWLMIWLVPRLWGVLPTHWHAVLRADAHCSSRLLYVTLPLFPRVFCCKSSCTFGGQSKEWVSQATREPIRVLWTSLSKTLSWAVHHRAAGHR